MKWIWMGGGAGLQGNRFQRGAGAKGCRVLSYAKEFGLHPVDYRDTLVNYKDKSNIRTVV